MKTLSSRPVANLTLPLSSERTATAAKAQVTLKKKPQQPELKQPPARAIGPVAPRTRPLAPLPPAPLPPPLRLPGDGSVAAERAQVLGAVGRPRQLRAQAPRAVGRPGQLRAQAPGAVRRPRPLRAQAPGAVGRPRPLRTQPAPAGPRVSCVVPGSPAPHAPAASLAPGAPLCRHPPMAPLRSARCPLPAL